MRIAAVLLALIVAACAGNGGQPRQPAALPAVSGYGALLPAGSTAYDNGSLADLFTTLTFETEWGGERARLVRFEAPVRLGLEGPGAARYRPFAQRFANYLRDNAGIDIGLASAFRGAAANLHIRFVESGAFTRVLPGAACVLAPGDLAWADYARRPDALGGDALLAAERLEQVTVFLPQSAPPHAVRACLLEEVTQALGPVNDLYGLGPSIFNDDFGHLWPTRLDLLMLRVLYAPEMESGLSRTEARRRARAVLARINPAGRNALSLPPLKRRNEGAWRKAVEAVVARGTPAGTVRAKAEEALALARASMPETPQHCHSLITLGRVLAQREPDHALRLFDRAAEICARVHGPEDVRLFWIRIEKAGTLLALGRPNDVLAETEGLDAYLVGHRLDERIAALYALRADAYLARQQGALSFAARRQARSWADYAFGVAPR